jgi:hypothetical protein
MFVEYLTKQFAGGLSISEPFPSRQPSYNFLTCSALVFLQESHDVTQCQIRHTHRNRTMKCAVPNTVLYGGEGEKKSQYFRSPSKNHSLYLNGIEMCLSENLSMYKIYMRNNAMHLINGTKLNRKR